MRKTMNYIGLITALIVSTTGGYSQCTNASSWGSAAAPTGTTTTTISSCTYQTEYNTVTAVVAGETYESTYSLGGCITVHSGTPGGPVVASGTTPLTWTATVNGTYYIHYNTSCITCGTATSCGTSTITCTSCSSTGCAAVAPVPNDACYQQVIASDPYCCNTSWDLVCQGDYDACNGGGGGCVAVAPVPNDACYQQVIASDPYCCNTSWDVLCQDDYDACSGGGGGGCTGFSTNDYCNDAALLAQGAGTWSSTTSSTYTADLPGNVGSVFCGSIENNSWYMFTAQSTTETFPITSVFNCNNGWGIQAQVYSFTTDVNGCCTGFTSVSNCYNPGTTTTGTVTANGLTVGNTYMLMIDGNAGDDCDFTISNWTATGILPVELVDFKGVAMPDENILTWKTKSEADNDHFNVMRSADGVNFEKIGEIDGAGSSSIVLRYSFTDRSTKTGKVYYRLQQVDFNGKTELSEVIVLDREADTYGIVDFWPNPANERLFVELNPMVGTTSNGLLEIVDIYGNKLQSMTINSQQFELLEFDLNNMTPGVYLLRYTDKRGSVTVRKFIRL